MTQVQNKFQKNFGVEIAQKHWFVIGVENATFSCRLIFNYVLNLKAAKKI